MVDDSSTPPAAASAPAAKVYYEGCPGCAMERKKESNKGVPYKELLLVGVINTRSRYETCMLLKEKKTLGFMPGFSVSTAWGLGVIIGPAIGGYLAQIFSLWTVSDRKYGGLSFSSKDVGQVLTVAGASLTVYQLFVYRWVDKIFGPIHSTRVAAPQEQRGAANGIATTAMSLFKAAAPAAGGVIFSWAQKRQHAAFFPGKHSVLATVKIAMLFCIIGLFNYCIKEIYAIWPCCDLYLQALSPWDTAKSDTLNRSRQKCVLVENGGTARVGGSDLAHLVRAYHKSLSLELLRDRGASPPSEAEKWRWEAMDVFGLIPWWCSPYSKFSSPPAVTELAPSPSTIAFAPVSTAITNQSLLHPVTCQARLLACWPSRARAPATEAPHERVRVQAPGALWSWLAGDCAALSLASGWASERASCGVSTREPELIGRAPPCWAAEQLGRAHAAPAVLLDRARWQLACSEAQEAEIKF
ncbi:hypothetical protein PR202_gn00814 [Eleusine coracana subsp. coracana]|uniref:Uncharacterized protein n=1 Tax=Eleusine coracana subsp. coracana TaxID=191504 RepID=A0AAV5G0Q5_ELECO|nr:hypothetical protein PR202_gn00814 [Eleusine coracana subsp. coracana]